MSRQCDIEQKFAKLEFKLCLIIIIYWKDSDNPIAHKLADMTLLAGAGLRGGQSCFNAVSVFSPFVPIFSPIPSREGKIRYIPKKKTVLSPGKIRTQVLHRGLGRAGRAGQQWLAGQGWGPGLGQAGAGGGTCVFLNKNVHRNRLECCFGAVC